jgi:acetyl esterase/lipase
MLAQAEEEMIPLWPNGAPGAKGEGEKHQPTLTIFPADVAKQNGTAIIICPGGGYAHISMDREGYQPARYLNKLGVTCFVLRYRLGGDGYKHPIPLQDAQRAMGLVRSRAAEWKLDPTKIGMMGFSAGGHLTSTLGTHFTPGDANADDPISRVSSRPDFLILCYPVITMLGEATHGGSRKALLGDSPSEELMREVSSELQVTKETPPTFLWHTDEDTGVPAENSVMFYLALRKNKVPAELHVFEKGKHGFGMDRPLLGTDTWPQRVAEWLGNRRLIQKPDAAPGKE